MRTKKLIRRTFSIKETNCTIISECETAISAAISAIKYHREKLERYITNHPEFLYTLSPLHVDKGPKVVRRMSEVSEKADVGPMAAVAGVLADLAVEEMLQTGCKVAVVENGGEVSAVSDVPIDIALVAGNHPLSKSIGFKLEEFPIGVATSSALFSHALSFGEAEAVTVFASNAGLADAVATAVGNMVKGDYVDYIIKRAVEKAISVEGVKGVLIIWRNTIGLGGQIPKLISIK